MIVVVAVALVMGVIVMVVVARPVGMIFVAMVFMIVIMGLEGCALAEFKLGRARDLHQLDHMRVRRQRLDRVRKPGGKAFTDPKHRLRLIQRPGLGRAHRVAVWRGARLYKEVGRAKPVHDHRNQRMNRRNVGNDGRHLCAGHPGKPQKGHRSQYHASSHEILLVML